LSRSFAVGADSYHDLVEAIGQAKLDVLYDAGYSEDIGLLLHQLRVHGIATQIMSDDSAMNHTITLVAGAAIEGLMFTYPRDPLRYHAVRALVAETASKGLAMDVFAVSNYAAIQVWSQAVRDANSFDFDKVVNALHSSQFDTVIGRIGFNADGDVVGERGDWVWYRWHNGKTAPLDAH